MPSDLGDSVHLNEVLISVVDVIDHAQVRIEDGLLVLEHRLKLELIADRGLARLKVATGRDMDFVKHIVVEVIYVRSDPWFLVGIDAERHDERFRGRRWRSSAQSRN